MEWSFLVIAGILSFLGRKLGLKGILQSVLTLGLALQSFNLNQNELFFLSILGQCLLLLPLFYVIIDECLPDHIARNTQGKKLDLKIALLLIVSGFTIFNTSKLVYFDSYLIVVVSLFMIIGNFYFSVLRKIILISISAILFIKFMLFYFLQLKQQILMDGLIIVAFSLVWFFLYQSMREKSVLSEVSS